MSESVRQELELLKQELEQDVLLCQTRDQHIRTIQRLARVNQLLTAEQ